MSLQVKRVDELPRRSMLEVLNACFPGWGGQREFAWIFERPCGAQPADVFLALADGEIAGLTALSYRRVLMEDGRHALMGIIGSSCTLPQFRGRGVFSAFVEATMERTASIGAQLYGAFVLKSNASFGRMMASGCGDVPALYGTCPRDQEREAAEQLVLRQPASRAAALERLFQAREREQIRANRFVYSFDAWVNQMAVRPAPTEVYHAGKAGEDCAWFLVERWPDKLRVLEMWPGDSGSWLEVIGALNALAVSEGKDVEWYVTDAYLQQLLRRWPGPRLEGSLVVTDLDRGALVRPREGEGERVAGASGSWFLQSGDRV